LSAFSNTVLPAALILSNLHLASRLHLQQRRLKRSTEKAQGKNTNDHPIDYSTHLSAGCYRDAAGIPVSWGNQQKNRGG
jgi:hypothetical protein